jgi:hypothetical protein
MYISALKSALKVSQEVIEGAAQLSTAGVVEYSDGSTAGVVESAQLE